MRRLLLAFLPAVMLAACGDGDEERAAGNVAIPASDDAAIGYAPADPAGDAANEAQANLAEPGPAMPAGTMASPADIQSGDTATPMGTGMSTEDVTGNGMITNETSDRGR